MPSLTNTILEALKKRKADLIESVDENLDPKELDEAKKKKTMKEEDDDKKKDDEEEKVVTEEDDEEEEDDDDKKKDDDDDDDDEEDMEEAKKKKAKKLKESLQKVFAKAKVDENVAKELETLFHAALSESVDSHKKELESQNAKVMEAFIDEHNKGIDKYVTYAINEWIETNEVALESGIRLELAENFIKGMHSLFTENFVEVPESKVDLIEEAEASIDKLISSLDEEKEKVFSLETMVSKMKSEKIVNELTSDMTDTEKEKLGTLVDSIEYTDDEEYKGKVKIIIENYFSAGDQEEKKTDKPSISDSRMDAYKKALSKK